MLPKETRCNVCGKAYQAYLGRCPYCVKEYKRRQLFSEHATPLTKQGNVVYAGIGSREAQSNVLDEIRDIGYHLAKLGYTLYTGACEGPNTAFAEGAIRGEGKVTLHLPWASYNDAWVDSVSHNKLVKIDVLSDQDAEAFASVDRYHPVPQKLSDAAKRLHARNYKIVRAAHFVVCWTSRGAVSGGTGQGIRIAKAMDREVINLYDYALCYETNTFKHR